MRLGVFLLLFPAVLLADKVILPDEEPWFTGPLLATTAYVTPLGHFNIEPYVFAIANTGAYDHTGSVVTSPTFWSNYLQPDIQVGIAPNMDVQIYPTVYCNVTQGAESWAFGDFPFTVDIGLLETRFETRNWQMGLKLSLTETIPTGKYRNLRPEKHFTQASGTGSWITGLVLVWGNLFQVQGKQYFNSRLNVGYSYPSPVHVTGFNYYGGGYGTDGTVYPGHIFDFDIGLEYSLSRNWALAMDIVGNWTTRYRFKGNPGVTATGQTAHIRSESSYQFSLAPALEYNWSEDIGLIVGSWFTIAGRNSSKFASFAAAFNYYY